jgi:hypothetical protein
MPRTTKRKPNASKEEVVEKEEPKITKGKKSSKATVENVPPNQNSKALAPEGPEKKKKGTKKQDESISDTKESSLEELMLLVTRAIEPGGKAAGIYEIY